MRAGADLRFLEGGFEKTDQKGVFKHLEIFLTEKKCVSLKP